MKEEIKWITIWVLAVSIMTALSLIYLYLSHELPIYGLTISSLYAVLTILPYTICKYLEFKEMQKRSIVIKILND